jgi:hypothetical protein
VSSFELKRKKICLFYTPLTIKERKTTTHPCLEDMRAIVIQIRVMKNSKLRRSRLKEKV